MPTLHQPPIDAALEARIERETTRIIKNLELYGWATTAIVADRESASEPFTFTTGFTVTLGVPEVVVCGFDYLLANTVLNCLGMRLQRLPLDERRRAVEDGATMRDLCGDALEVAFHALGSYREAGCLHLAANVLGHDFPVVQLLIPDQDNHLPTSPLCEREMARRQAWPPSRESLAIAE